MKYLLVILLFANVAMAQDVSPAEPEANPLPPVCKAVFQGQCVWFEGQDPDPAYANYALWVLPQIEKALDDTRNKYFGCIDGYYELKAKCGKKCKKVK